jgi:hypothetical protein
MQSVIRQFENDAPIAHSTIDLHKTIVVCPRQAEEARLGRKNSMRAPEAIFPKVRR